MKYSSELSQLTVAAFGPVVRGGEEIRNYCRNNPLSIMVVQDGPPHGGLPFPGRNQTQPCGSGSLEFVDWIRIRVLQNQFTRYGSGPHGIGWLHTDPGPAQLVDRMWIWVLQNWLNKNPAPAELVDRILIQVPWTCLDTGKGPAELVDRVRTLVPRNWLNGFGSRSHEIS